MTTDDTFVSIIWDLENGRAVTIGPEFVLGVSFFPKPADSGARCPGYPRFDLVSDSFYPLKTVRVRDEIKIEDAVFLLESTMFDISETHTGYICACIPSTWPEKEKQSFLELLAKRVGSNKNISILSGTSGTRFKLEFFANPKIWPKPSPRCTPE
ncbi:MAG: hypothetical protein R2684_10040 [Pyrinomonadaceae bacterium]